MSPKQLLRRISDRLFGTALDRAVRRLARDPRHSILFCWNRGLGDIALGLVPVFALIRREVPDARIAVVTRPELEEAFRMTDANDIRVIPGLARDAPIGDDDIRSAAGLELREFAVVFAYPDPARWLSGRRGEFPPSLSWDPAWDAYADRFVPAMHGVTFIGAHVDSETARYYNYQKDWPPGAWRDLFGRFDNRPDVRWVLFGQSPEPDYARRNVVDLRGRTGYLELASVIRNRCRVLIAPDSGVLATAYYLAARFPLEVISLWSDPRQGILQQGSASPNPLLRHIPIVGRDELAANIPVSEVEAAVRAALR